MALTRKQQAFIDHYFACGMNGTRAAIRAGYAADSASVEASRLLRNANVAEVIQRIFRENTMPADEVLARLTDHARGDIGDLLDDSGNIDIKAARAQGKTALIKKIKRTVTTFTDEDGNGRESFSDEIELHSSQAALQLLGKYHKLFTERVQVELTWQDEAVERIRSGELSYPTALEVFDHDDELVKQLFAKAQIPVSVSKE